jgi:hypothetical protein
MSQSIGSLNSKVQCLNDLIEEKGNGLVQQCLSTPHFLCLQTRYKGRTLYLYLGRGAQYQGFDYSDEKPPSLLRIQDKFLQFSRKNWRGMQIQKIEAYQKDRILTIKGRLGPNPVKVWFFWRGRDLFFAHCELRAHQVHFFKSWIGKCKVNVEDFDNLSLMEVFEDLGVGSLAATGKRVGDLNIERYLKQYSTLQSVALAQNNKITERKLKTIEKIKEDLRKFETLDYLQKQTERDLTDVGSIGEGRFSINFKGLEGHFKKREFLFDKIKGWRKSQTFLKKRLDSLTQNQKKVETIRGQEPELGKVVQPIWAERKEFQHIEKKANFIELQYKGLKVFLGRTALENDYIRKNIAKKEDLWLHLDGYKSGHLFIKNPGNVLNMDDYATLGSALVDLNGIEINDIPIIYTQVKNLKGVKGSPGMVNYKKEKHIVVFFDQDWRQKLTSIEVGEDG